MLPRKFRVYSGGFLRKCRTLEWKTCQLVYFEQEAPNLPVVKPSVVFLKPSPSDWEEFANSLIKAGAYSWDGHNFEEQVTDGVEFEIWVTFRHRIKLSCYHRFPQNFSIFLDAINALTKASPDSPFYFTCDD